MHKELVMKVIKFYGSKSKMHISVLQQIPVSPSSDTHGAPSHGE